MIYVKVKAKGIRLTIPMPYTILNIAIPILTSKFVQQRANKHFESKKLDFTFPQIDKKMLKPIVKELKNSKGLILVDVKLKDGTEVMVRL
ncbi:MAG: hypothetical protein RR595_03295 [Lysinibacillus sp.]